MYIRKNQPIFTLAVYELTDGTREDFRICGSFLNTTDASRAGTLECQYYVDRGYNLDYNGWANGFGGKNKYVWQLSRGNDIVSIIWSINPLS